jgi:hypothetical protein
MSRAKALLFSFWAWGAACIPNLGPGDSLVTTTRVLAVRADPPEAVPGTKTTFTSFVVGPTGTVTGSPIAWDFCTSPKPLTEDNVVSNACLGASSALVPAGEGAAVSAATPSGACSVFGPDTSEMDLRPADPDSTGGYYQPLRADLGGSDETFALIRIHCDLPSATAQIAMEFATMYTLNQNPSLLPLTGTIGGSAATLTSIPAGSSVTFTASWPPASAETFAYVDPTGETLATQREAMQVAWYSTAGEFDAESTGRASTDMATTTENGFTAPSAAGPLQIFLVLRDSRGGFDFATYDVTVTP